MCHLTLAICFPYMVEACTDRNPTICAQRFRTSKINHFLNCFLLKLRIIYWQDSPTVQKILYRLLQIGVYACKDCPLPTFSTPQRFPCCTLNLLMMATICSRASFNLFQRCYFLARNRFHLLDRHRTELVTHLRLRGKGFNMDYTCPVMIINLISSKYLK